MTSTEMPRSALMRLGIVPALLRGPRVALLSFVYASVAAASLYLAYEIRFDFLIPVEIQQDRLKVLWLVVPVKLLALALARQMGSMITYFGVPDFFRLCAALIASALFLIVLRFSPGSAHLSPPRGVLLIDFLVCLSAFCSFRLGARLFRERIIGGGADRSRVTERVVIIGAGNTGASLAGDLIAMPRKGFRPVAFLDDDPDKHGRSIHGLDVLGRPEDFAKFRALENVSHAIVAMPSAPSKRLGEIALLLGRLGVQVETVPALEDLASGKAKVSRIRPVEIQDLLGREQVPLDATAIRHLVANKVVMVTGGGGSIGSELCRQIVALNPRRLLVVDQAEPLLFQIEQELNELGFGGAILPVVADVLDTMRMAHLFAVHAPHIVFHAAAHKHVYLMERQPAEAVKNNAIGTRKLAEIAVENGTEAFVLISTDKAINPTNLMGASKRLAELHLQALHAGQIVPTEEGKREKEEGREDQQKYLQGKKTSTATNTSLQGAVTRTQGRGERTARTKLMAVRFGNVLGSSGSVVPIFKKQIEAGGPVTVTHPDVTRYFMTIPEAVGLVLQASALGQGGEIFVLDMGQPMKIVDLAKNMIELSGFKLGEDIDITFSGLKPGEKLFEELRHHSEEHLPTEHARIMRFVSGGDAVKASKMAIEEIEPFLNEMAPNDLKRALKLVIPEYEPYLE